MYRQKLSQAALELNSRSADVQLAQAQIDTRTAALENMQAPLEEKRQQLGVAEHEFKRHQHNVGFYMISVRLFIAIVWLVCTLLFKNSCPTAC